MKNTHKGSIVLIDDNLEDLSIFAEGFKFLKPENKVMLFDNPNQAIKLLLTSSQMPFLILCDIDLGPIDAFSFRNHLLSCNSAFASVPFMFFSNGRPINMTEYNHTHALHGFFQKPVSFAGMVDTLRLILDYWQMCRIPDSLSQNSRTNSPEALV
jgi:response regulator RpfG family c-di-GMP phosphodiesterase